MQLLTVYMRINTAVVVVMCLCNLCLLMVVVVFVREGCEYISLCKVLFKSFCDIFSVFESVCFLVHVVPSCHRNLEIILVLVLVLVGILDSGVCAHVDVYTLSYLVSCYMYLF